MKLIKTLIKLKDNNSFRIVAGNAFSLYLIKGLSFFFPLIIIPIILKTVGDDNYGRYVYSFAIIQYLKLIVNYGFQFTGTRDVARVAGNLKKTSEISSEILILRIILAFFSSFILIGIGLYYKQDKWLYFWGCGSLFGFALQSTWFFQGIQKMHIISSVILTSKLIVIVLIVFFIEDKEDYIYLNLIDSIGYLGSGLMSCLIMKYRFGVRLIATTYYQLINQLKTGYKLFASTIFISLYREANVIILVQFTDFKIAGYYSIAEKITKSIQGISQPISQALFPYFAKGFKNKDTLSQFNRISRYLGLLFLTGSILLAVFSKIIIKVYLGEGYDRVSLNLMLLSPVVVTGILNYYYGVIGLVNMNKDGKFSLYVGIAGTINIILCSILSYLIEDTGASISLAVSEIMLFILLYSYWRLLTKNTTEISH